jgi:hypothetical protein
VVLLYNNDDVIVAGRGFVRGEEASRRGEKNQGEDYGLPWVHGRNIMPNPRVGDDFI